MSRRDLPALIAVAAGLALALLAALFVAVNDRVGVPSTYTQRPADIALAAALASFLSSAGCSSAPAPDTRSRGC